MVRTSPSWLKLTVASKDTVGINPNEWWTSRSTQLIWLNRSPWISMELKVHVSLSFRNFLVPTNQKSGCFNPAQKFNLFLSIFGWLSLVLNICTICIYIHIHNYQILCSMVKTCYMTIYIYIWVLVIHPTLGILGVYRSLCIEKDCAISRSFDHGTIVETAKQSPRRMSHPKLVTVSSKISAFFRASATRSSGVNRVCEKRCYQ